MSNRILTWLDVQRIFHKKTHRGLILPPGVVSIRCYSDAAEIEISDHNCKESIKQVLGQWFGDWYKEGSQGEVIQLDIDEGQIPVEFIPSQEITSGSQAVRPFWENVAYLDVSDSDKSTLSKYLPDPFPEHAPKFIAFYSFKGGVGRTLHLVAYLSALLNQANRTDQPIKVLVIDADLEAPGLTYWRDLKSQVVSFSFVDFLEIYHYAQAGKDAAIKYAAKEIRKSSKLEGRSNIFFLPAFTSEEQLLDTPILPEHIAKYSINPWEFSDAICALGACLEADYIFVDLRAGLSEVSSPILFDPRVNRFLVSTSVDQSVKGTSLVLGQISNLSPGSEETNPEKYCEPTVIVSFLTKELKALPEFDDALVALRRSYPQSDEEGDFIIETDFAQELLYVNGWREAKQRLTSTSIMSCASKWAERQMSSDNLEETAVSPVEQQLTSVASLKDTCQKYVFAESGEGDDLLITEPIRNLALKYQDDLPRVVSIGAKGSGKTFNYIQLSRLKYWEDFVSRVINDQSPAVTSKTYIYPLLQSRNLEDKARQIVDDCRQSAANITSKKFSYSEIRDKIDHELGSISGEEGSDDRRKLKWTRFWLGEIANVIGMDVNRSQDLKMSDIDTFLKEKSLKIVFMFDGLEDIFPSAAIERSHQIALNALISLPERLADLRSPSLGLIVFLRRDFLVYTVNQNYAQFENLYQPYSLSWDPDSFLRLVYWICAQAEIIDAQQDNIPFLTREDLLKNLEKLWGEKLGSPTSKEAISARWIYSALTDFNGRLQARDVVRFLLNAANISLEQKDEIQFNRWSRSRLLPPQSIRRALGPCSEKKVDEIKEEYPTFREWCSRMETDYPVDKRAVPFQLDDYDIKPDEIKMLKEIGAVIEDTDKGKTQYYMPEIFRTGLGFSLKKGARPRVIILSRRAIGNNPF